MLKIGLKIMDILGKSYFLSLGKVINKNFGDFMFANRYLYIPLILISAAYPQCSIGDCEDGWGKFIYSENLDSDGFYEGYFKNGYRHGQGKYTWEIGHVYEGEWFEGSRTGFGKIVYNSGNIYEGDWKDSERIGYGKYIWPNGTIYIGTWKETRMGFGIQKWGGDFKGDVYFGEWKDDYIDGYGGMMNADKSEEYGVWSKGTLYKSLDDDEVGKYLEGKYYDLIERIISDFDENIQDESNFGCTSGNCNNGFGIYVYDGEFLGDYYEGDFKNGLKSGSGVYSFSNGDKYVGDFNNDYSNGFGIYTFLNGDIYEGSFKNGFFDGLGVTTFKNGDIFEGQFTNGQINGLGLYKWSNDWEGQMYIGEYIDGFYTGYGIMRLKDESFEIGIWNNDDLYKALSFEEVNDYFIKKYPNLIDYLAEKYLGEYENDNKNECLVGDCYNGWSHYLIGNDSYVGNFFNGLFHGFGTYKWGKGDWEGEEFSGTWSEGSYIDGKYIWPNGDVYIGKWRKSLKHGYGKLIESNGNIYEGIWDEGVLIESNNSTYNNKLDIYETNQLEEFEVGAYHALIISANDYKYDKDYYYKNINKQNGYWSDLNHPINDGRKLRDVLVSEYSFDYNNIQMLENPTRSDIIENLEFYKDQLKETDNFLLFYAGHGHWLENDRRRGYWIPVDGQVNSRANWLSDGTVKDIIGGIKSKNILVIADACFSGAIFQSRSINQDQSNSIEQAYMKKSRIVITSGNLEPVPDRSIFIENILRELKSNNNKYFSSKSIYDNIFNPVKYATENEPQRGHMPHTGDENGDFIFIKN